VDIARDLVDLEEAKQVAALVDGREPGRLKQHRLLVNGESTS